MSAITNIDFLMVKKYLYIKSLTRNVNQLKISRFYQQKLLTQVKIGKEHLHSSKQPERWGDIDIPKEG